MILCVVAGLVLSMNTATMDGSRALYGIAKDGMTIRQFGKLNRFRVPALAMTVDALLNILLISFFNNPIEIIAVSNIGYVFATCAALSGFLLLRKDRPQWPRPVHLSSLWIPLGGFLLAANFIFLVFGGFIYSGGFLGIRDTATDGTRRGGACWCCSSRSRSTSSAMWCRTSSRSAGARRCRRRRRRSSHTASSPPRRPRRRPSESPRGPARQSARRSQRGRSAIAAR